MSEQEETPAQRRRRLAAVFGETPESSSDERDPREDGAEAGPSGSSGSSESPGERWLREQVPPHHG